MLLLGLGVLAIAVIYLGGPTLFVLGLPLAVGALLGLQSLALGMRRAISPRPGRSEDSGVPPRYLQSWTRRPAGTWP